MTLRACGKCEKHRTHNLTVPDDEDTLATLWSQLEKLPRGYTRPEDRRIPDLWSCLLCGAYTWDEIGEKNEFAGRFTWNPGSDQVERLSDLGVANND